jgi:hypothetical protein
MTHRWSLFGIFGNIVLQVVTEYQLESQWFTDTYVMDALRTLAMIANQTGM